MILYPESVTKELTKNDISKVFFDMIKYESNITLMEMDKLKDWIINFLSMTPEDRWHLISELNKYYTKRQQSLNTKPISNGSR